MIGQGTSLGYGTQPATSWWQRNWKWVVPIGCLGMFFAFVAFVGVIVLIVFGSIKSSEPVEHAYRVAKTDPRVHAVLGRPVEEGFFVSGNVTSNGATGSADLSLPVSGPKGSGTLYVVARKHAGRWEYRELQLQVDGKYGRINLVGPAAAPATTEPADPTPVAPAPEPVTPPEPAAGGTYNTP
jgi:hypothetical protein